MPAIDTTLTDSGSAQPGPVIVWNIFWAVLFLTLACVTHPISSASAATSENRHALHGSAIHSALDALFLVIEVGHVVRHNRGHLLQACGEVSAIRLQQNCDPVLQDRRIRISLAIIFILQYIKLRGYHGICFLTVYLTVHFGSWALMELIFILGSFHSSPNIEQRQPRTSAGERHFWGNWVLVWNSMVPLLTPTAYQLISLDPDSVRVPSWLVLPAGPGFLFDAVIIIASLLCIILITVVYVLVIIIVSVFYYISLVVFHACISKCVPAVQFQSAYGLRTCVNLAIGTINIGLLVMYCSMFYNPEWRWKSG